MSAPEPEPLLGATARRHRERDEDEVAEPRQQPAPTKLSTRDLGDAPASWWQGADPGKLTAADVGRDVMSPADALAYARRTVDVAQTSGDAEDQGKLASAVSFDRGDPARAVERATEKLRVSRRARAGGRSDRATATAAVEQARTSSGAPLPDALRVRFERSLGVPLADVRVHTDAAAAAAADALSARAYTLGRDIYFAAGEYDAASTSGAELLAHEVAHTVQHTGGAPSRGGALEVSEPGDALEVEADRAADAMVAGHAAPLDHGGSGVARQGIHRRPNSYAVGDGLTWSGSNVELTAEEYSTFASKHAQLISTAAGLATKAAEWAGADDAVEDQLNAQIEGDIARREAYIENLEDQVDAIEGTFWTDPTVVSTPERLADLKRTLAAEKAALEKIEDGEDALEDRATAIATAINDFAKQVASIGTAAKTATGDLSPGKFTSLDDLTQKVDTAINAATLIRTVSDRSALHAFQSEPNFETAAAWGAHVGKAFEGMAFLAEGLPAGWDEVIGGLLKMPTLVISNFTSLVRSRYQMVDEMTRDPSNCGAELLPGGGSSRPCRKSDGNEVAAGAETALARASRSRGEPLPDPVRAQLERSLGASLGGVRVHDDSESAQASQAIGARAYALGQDIHFATGQYDPDSAAGRQLLAHEVAHTVQQVGATSSAGGGLEVSQPGDAHELEADAFAEAFVAGEDASVSPVTEGSVSRAVVSRDLFSDLVLGGSNLVIGAAEGLGLATHDEAEAARLAAYIAHGVFGPEDLVPPTNIGGFAASYDPAANALSIQVRTGITFVNGLSIDPAGTITSNQTDLAQAATDGNAMPAADRAAFVTDFTWTTAQEDVFIAALQTKVEGAWNSAGTGLTFTCTKPGWSALTATVNVDIDVHRGAATGTDHLQSTVYKVPDSGTYTITSAVDGDRNSGSAFDNDPHNNGVEMSSTDVNPTPAALSLLSKSVQFAPDSAVLDATAQGTINGFAIDFQDANLDLTNPVQLVGHSSTSGTEEHNRLLAQQRIDAVKAQLTAQGFTGMNDRVTTQNQGETGATEDAEWRRVDMIVGSGEGQMVATHEFGHVFGLLDEYAVNPGGGISGTGNATGTVVGHDAMARAIGVNGAVSENNDGAMSLGNTVRPQHYATFGWALIQVSRMAEWKVG